MGFTSFSASEPSRRVRAVRPRHRTSLGDRVRRNEPGADGSSRGALGRPRSGSPPCPRHPESVVGRGEDRPVPSIGPRGRAGGLGIRDLERVPAPESASALRALSASERFAGVDPRWIARAVSTGVEPIGFGEASGGEEGQIASSRDSHTHDSSLFDSGRPLGDLWAR